MSSFWPVHIRVELRLWPPYFIVCIVNFVVLLVETCRLPSKWLILDSVVVVWFMWMIFKDGSTIWLECAGAWALSKQNALFRCFFHHLHFIWVGGTQVVLLSSRICHPVVGLDPSWRFIIGFLGEDSGINVVRVVKSAKPVVANSWLHHLLFLQCKYWFFKAVTNSIGVCRLHKSNCSANVFVLGIELRLLKLIVSVCILELLSALILAKGWNFHRLGKLGGVQLIIYVLLRSSASHVLKLIRIHCVSYKN